MLSALGLLNKENNEELQWCLTVNTEATTEGAKVACTPIWYESNMPESLVFISWGDGSSNTISSEDFLDASSYNGLLENKNLTHEYSKPGVYEITISGKKDTDFQLFAQDSYTTGVIKDYIKNYNETLLTIKKIPRSYGTKRSTSRSSIKTFESVFFNCKKLANLPEDLLYDNTDAQDFLGIFELSGITTLPAALFSKSINATLFSRCFTDCSNLLEIPETLFSSNTNATYFNFCFSGCTKLTKIPETLFSSNINAVDFSSCFSGCTNLETIPSTLFSSNIKVTLFLNCFSSCSNLTEIPETLFSSNTNVTNFSYCFSECTNLKIIPSTLFNSNAAAINFSSCFRYCSKLEEVPRYLFKNNLKIESLAHTFHETGITNFEIDIPAENVKLAEHFCNDASEGVTRKIHVKAGTVTEATFNALADSLGLTVISDL